MSLSLKLVAATAAGVGSHLSYFIHGEHHMEAPFLVLLLPLYFLAVFVSQTSSDDVYQGLKTSTLVCGTYAAALYTSIVVYRLFFHQLRKFPGPAFAKVTKFWHFFKVLDSKNYLLLEKLHQQYGDIVRTGTSVFLT